MSHTKPGFSELNHRFALLFSQVFGCDWADYLIAEYEIQGLDGRTYYIDYVYEGAGEKIGIELEGRDKFFRYKHVFNSFFPRRNSIQMAGITPVYSFTWSDVVDSGGYRARNQLLQIFKGKLIPRSERLPLEAPQPWPMDTKREISPSYQMASCPAANIKSIEYRPWPPLRQRTLLKQVALIIVFAGSLIALVFSVLGREFSQPPQETPQTVVGLRGDLPVQILPKRRPIVKIMPLSKRTHTATRSHQPSKPVNRSHYSPVTTPLAAHGHHLSTTIPATVQTADRPITAKLTSSLYTPIDLNTPIPTKSQNVSQPIVPDASSVNDEIVAFNAITGIYHNPSCYWAQRCTQHCEYISRRQAEQRGGRPARSCGPHD